VTSYAAERRLRLRHVYARSVDVAVLTTDANARRRVRFVWLLLFANVLSFGDGATLIPIPGSIARPLLQAALLAALVLALTVNPRALVLPSVYLLALTLLAGSALAMGLQNEFYLGSTYRALRLATFVVTLWLLTPWWSAPGRPLLRFHLQALGAVLASVAVGAIVAPGKAFSFEGRLSGAVWPIPATQVAHYAAVALGVGVLLWLSGRPTTKAAVLEVLGGAVR